MLLLNTLVEYGRPLEARDANLFSHAASQEVESFLSLRGTRKATPLISLRGLAGEVGIRSVHIKDEGQRLGLGSFKALGGAYAVITLVLEEATRRLGRRVQMNELGLPEVGLVARSMTVSCATDGNHGRSVAQGAQMVGCGCAIFVHSGVSDERAAAIAHYGADIIRVEGNYDDSIAEASRVAEEKGWITVSDTSWSGYERIPGFVMQGYTALLEEAMSALEEVPTHVFVQAGVGGIAAASSGYMAERYGDRRPYFVVVEPARAACILKSARAGAPTKISTEEPTVMAMLECYEPSLIAWRILARTADAFMTVDEEAAINAMKRLAFPAAGDPAIIAGESGGVGVAALLDVAGDAEMRAQVGLNDNSRVLLINTEGATDPELYQALVGVPAERVRARDQMVGTPR
jgi:diaminopropionate ammonia-lyase